MLGAIVLAGSVVTSAAVMYRMGSSDCGAHHRTVDRSYTYSGIGVVIERHQSDVVVRRVMRGSPATGLLHPGARLVSVDGEVPETVDAWAEAIRGEPGSVVELEVAYPCGGHKTVAITRDVVKVSY